MDVLCFSFDCTFNDEGSSNCSTTDPKYSKTTTPTPTTQLAPLSTSHRTATALTSISTPITPEPKPSPGRSSTTTVPTEIPTLANPSSQKPTVVTTPKSSISTLTTGTLPHTVTTSVSVTTTANNSRLPDPPMPHKGTSHLPGDSAGGKSIYIPCSVVGCVIVLLFVSISVIRRHRNRRRSSEERQHLHPDSGISFDVHPFEIIDTQRVQPATLTANGDPMFSDVPLDDDISDTEGNEVERIDLIHLSSGESDDLETSPRVNFDEVIFDASTVRQKHHNHGVNNSGVV
ncbi:endochitinase A-like [Mizuhopecten yessoensis]|uniref:endochitinase A-like n=1 Tax=Mizuhopecten yessoensis TaxID=6573 RepID=UPI000B45A38F|nr:endochitinase A-like [Mizuhopecten yessoensis]